MSSAMQPASNSAADSSQAIKSYQRKVNKLIVYGRTHQGPRRRRGPRRKANGQKNKTDRPAYHGYKGGARGASVMEPLPEVSESVIKNLDDPSGVNIASQTAYAVLNRTNGGGKQGRQSQQPWIAVTSIYDALSNAPCNDPETLEMLVQDLAKALPDPAHNSEDILEPFGIDFSARPKRASWHSDSHSSQDSGKNSSNRRHSVSQSLESNASAKLSKSYNLHDPTRDARVAVVVKLAEEERQRRINEDIECNLQDRLERARRIEWAVKAIEDERARRAGLYVDDTVKMPCTDMGTKSVSKYNKVLEEVEQKATASNGGQASELAESGASSDGASAKGKGSSVKSYGKVRATEVFSDDYDVICPYSSFGCDKSCLRSELSAHFEECPARVKFSKYDAVAMYNPLNYIVACPYRIVGCDYMCKRTDLPEHLLSCPERVYDHYTTTNAYDQEIETYEVVCPYATMGCVHTCLRSEIPAHLAKCSHRPISRNEEEDERRRNKMMAIAAAERERKRRVSNTNDERSRTAQNHKSIHAVLAAIASQRRSVKAGDGALDSRLGKRHVQWLVRAAEIEIMRQKLEQRIMMQGASSSCSVSVTSTRSATEAPTLSTAAKSRSNKSSRSDGSVDSVSLDSSLTPAFEPFEYEVSSVSSGPNSDKSNVSVTSQYSWVSQGGGPGPLQEETSKLPSPPDKRYHDHMEKQSSKLHEILHEEVMLYSDKCMMQSARETEEIEKTVSKLTEAATTCFSTAMCVRIFGSYATGLAVPGYSDLDVVVTIPSNERTEGKSKQKSGGLASIDKIDAAIKCNILGRTLRRAEWIKRLKVIDRAQVPVIKLSTENLDVDLTFALPEHAGLKTVALVHELRELYPPLTPLTLVIKTFLAKSGLGDPFTGGLSSYALVIMIVASIRRSARRGVPMEGKEVLGWLLLDFLELYCRDFNPSEDAVICTRGNIIRVARRRDVARDEHVSLVVYDPISRGNNVGRSCFRFKQVQSSFADALASFLSTLVRCEAIDTSLPLLNQILNCD